MSYAYSYGFDRNQFDKYATIQEDISDTYLHLVDEDTDTEMQEIEKDVFGFADAIQLDHLTDEQLDQVLAIFGDK
jgi:hypothetical protein